MPKFFIHVPSRAFYCILFSLLPHDAGDEDCERSTYPAALMISIVCRAQQASEKATRTN